MTYEQIHNLFKQRYNQNNWKKFLGEVFAKSRFCFMNFGPFFLIIPAIRSYFFILFSFSSTSAYQSLSGVIH